MLWMTLVACLIDTDLYEERRAALADDDADGVTVEQGDCDDGDATVHPGAEERCDGVDQDCDGGIDEDATDATAWYPDGDGDQHGAGQPSWACEAPEGTAATDGDCDDGDARVHPGADEVPYDGVDQDCDEGDLTDADGDGWDAVEAGGEDCDDADADTWPGAADAWYDGVDSDCGGEDDADADGDGYAAADHGGEDCDDADAAIHPGAAETWANGATDNDCDGDYGAATLEYGAEAWTGEAAGDNAGRRVSALGDLDGDGLAEFLVGAPYHGGEYSYGGAVYVVYGGDPGPLGEEGKLAAGGEGWMLGSALAAGEADGDSVIDAVLSATNWSTGRGAVWLVSGADLPREGTIVQVDTTASLTVEGDAAEAYLGAAVVLSEDMDGDGVPEVIAGATHSDSGGLTDNGVVAIFNVAEGVVSASDADHLLHGYYDGQVAGGNLAPAGDQDGDGYNDLMVGSEGVIATIVAGGTAVGGMGDGVIAEVVGDESLDRADPRMVGDIDGDGRLDLAIIINSVDTYLYTNLPGTPRRGHGDTVARVLGGGEGTFAYDVLDLGDLDDDDRSETLISLTELDGDSRPRAGVLFGAEVRVDLEVSLLALDLQAICSRTDTAYGYRMALSDDIDGDSVHDILMATGGDDSAGYEAGGVIAIPAPR